MSDIIVVQTSDLKTLEISVEEAKLSVTMKNLLDDVTADPTTGKVTVPLPNIDFGTMQRIATYMKYHVANPEEHLNYRAGKTCDDMGTWDRDFCKSMNNNVLLHVVLAANYLDMQDLLELTCRFIAGKIKGKTPDEIREELKLEEEVPVNQ